MSLILKIFLILLLVAPGLAPPVDAAQTTVPVGGIPTLDMLDGEPQKLAEAPRWALWLH